MSHVPHIWVIDMSHIWMCRVAWMLHACMSQAERNNISRHRYECVMSHIWMCRVTHMNVSCHTYECVMLHTCCMHTWIMSNVQKFTSHLWIFMSHVRFTSHLWLFMFHVRMRHATIWICHACCTHIACMHESCRTPKYVTSHVDVWIVQSTLMTETCHANEWVVS